MGRYLHLHRVCIQHGLMSMFRVCNGFTSIRVRFLNMLMSLSESTYSTHMLSTGILQVVSWMWLQGMLRWVVFEEIFSWCTSLYAHGFIPCKNRGKSLKRGMRMTLKVNEDKFWVVKFCQQKWKIIFSIAVMLWQQKKPNKKIIKCSFPRQYFSTWSAWFIL